MNAFKRQPKQAARATRVITDPADVAFLCEMLGGREPRPGEVLELVHVRDQLWEVRSAATKQGGR